jgi:hypothetical protein
LVFCQQAFTTIVQRQVFIFTSFYASRDLPTTQHH